MKKCAIVFLIFLCLATAVCVTGCADGTTPSNGGEGDTHEDTVDRTAPTISGVEAPIVTATSATIRWATDEPSTSGVSYCVLTIGSNDNVCQAFPADDTPGTSHEVALTALAPGTTYKYWVHSKDGVGNEAELSDFLTTEVLVMGDASAVADGAQPCLRIPFMASNTVTWMLFHGVGEDWLQVGSTVSEPGGDAQAMVPMGPSGRSPGAGTYRLTLDQGACGSEPAHIQEYYYCFSGAEVAMSGLQLSWGMDLWTGQWQLCSAAFVVANTGDLPVFICGVRPSVLLSDTQVDEGRTVDVSPVAAVEAGQSQLVGVALCTYGSPYGPSGAVSVPQSRHTYTLKLDLLDSSDWAFCTWVGDVDVPR
ncbi:MAG: hypothetical protein FJ020_08380 [Chloroflexi bacterium]|nr:hypothetical protein [Chloroflexota bacterium]